MSLNLIVLFMGAYETDSHGSCKEHKHNHRSVVVPFDVEHIAVVANKVRRGTSIYISILPKGLDCSTGHYYTHVSVPVDYLFSYAGSMQRAVTTQMVRLRLDVTRRGHPRVI